MQQQRVSEELKNGAKSPQSRRSEKISKDSQENRAQSLGMRNLSQALFAKSGVIGQVRKKRNQSRSSNDQRNSAGIIAAVANAARVSAEDSPSILNLAAKNNSGGSRKVEGKRNLFDAIVREAPINKVNAKSPKYKLPPTHSMSGLNLNHIKHKQ